MTKRKDLPTASAPFRFLLLTTTATLLSIGLISCGQTGAPAVSPLGPGATGAECLASADLFTEVIPEASVDSIQSGDGPARRTRWVRLDSKQIRRRLASTEPRLSLNLFADKNVVIQIDETRQVDAESISIQGHIENHPESEVSLINRHDALAGSIVDHENAKRYEIRPSENGLLSIEVVSSEDQGECLAIPAPVDEEAPPSLNGDAPLASSPIIDILVAYTPKAASASGGVNGILALIQSGIEDTNAAFIDSSINLQVRLVGIIALRQNETTNFSGDLSSLRTKGDGKWDEVHTERARLGADQVTLLGAYSGAGSTAGIGYIGATTSSAFTIVKTNSFGQYTMTHELGHNMGLEHADGYVNSSGGFRTVMAYGTPTRIRRFSSATLRYRGYSTGNSGHNSASIANGNASRISNLVVSTVPATPIPKPSPTPPPAIPPQSTPTPEPSPDPIPLTDPPQEPVPCPT